MGNVLLVGLIRSLHDILSIIWIGSLFSLSFVIIPVVKKKFNKEEEKKIMNDIFDKLSFFIIISIVFLIFTGILEHRFAKISSLKIGKSLPYSYFIIHLLKYILTGIMVLIVIVRQIMRRKMKKQLAMVSKVLKESPDLVNSEVHAKKSGKNKPYLLVYLNTYIGLIVVILSGLLAVMK